MGQLIITPSLDGSVSYESPEPWETCHGASSGYAYIAAAAVYGKCISWQDIDEFTWFSIHRNFLVFDTSGLPDGATIDSATLMLNIWDTNNVGGIGVYESTQASPTALANADFDNFGTTLFAALTAAEVSSVASNKVMTLNAAGLAVISKTGYTKFCIRETGYDVANSAPPTPGGALFSWRSRLFGDETKRPTLTVNYTEASSGPSRFWLQEA